MSSRAKNLATAEQISRLFRRRWRTLDASLYSTSSLEEVAENCLEMILDILTITPRPTITLLVEAADLTWNTVKKDRATSLLICFVFF